jgi:hypothetical protein
MHYLFFKNTDCTLFIYFLIGYRMIKRVELLEVFGNSVRCLIYLDWAAKLEIMCISLQMKGDSYGYVRTGNGNRG